MKRKFINSNNAAAPSGFLILALLCFILFGGCSKEPVPPSVDDIFSKLTLSAQLATVEYRITKLIKAEDMDWYTIGDRKVLLSCEAVVKAGVDMNRIEKSDVTISGKTVSISAPHARIVSLNIDPKSIKILYNKIDPLRSEFTSAELEDLQRQAQADIEQKITSMDILKNAEINFKTVISSLLRASGFTAIEITFRGGDK